VLATPKPEARIALTVPDSEGKNAPLMGWWRYGNGQVLAFTSDATGAWTDRWQHDARYGSLWAGIVRSLQPDTLPPGHHLSAYTDGETLHVKMVAIDDEGRLERGLAPVAIVQDPHHQSIRLRLLAAEAGYYGASVPLGSAGRYDLHLDGGEDSSATVLHSYNSAFEYGRQTGTANWLAEITGGTTRTLDEAIAAGGGLSLHWAPWRTAWLLIALALFFADLVKRYAHLSWRMVRPTTAIWSEGRG
jgi:hypothetical protein